MKKEPHWFLPEEFSPQNIILNLCKQHDTTLTTPLKLGLCLKVFSHLNYSDIIATEEETTLK